MSNRGARTPRSEARTMERCSDCNGERDALSLEGGRCVRCRIAEFEAKEQRRPRNVVTVTPASRSVTRDIGGAYVYGRGVSG